MAETNARQNNTLSKVMSIVIGYAIVSTGCFMIYSYSDGKSGLSDFRGCNKRYFGTSYELGVIETSVNFYDNFYKALFFPWSIVSKIMPMFVLFMNPYKDD